MIADRIVVEQTYGAPIAVVWKAITDKDQMRQWFFEPMTDFELWSASKRSSTYRTKARFTRTNGK